MVWTQQKQTILRRDGKHTQKNYIKKDFNDPDNHNGVITHLEPDILKYKVKWDLSIIMNKASGGDGIPVELFQILMRWMKLEPIIQSEVSQKEKHQYSILTHIYGIQKDGNSNPVYETAKETLGAPTKENTLILIAADIGGKNTQEQDQIRS